MVKWLINLITGDLLGKVLEGWRLYQQKQISAAEFESRVQIAAEESAAKAQQAWADATAKYAESVQSTVRSSAVIQRGYVVVLFLQLFVLVWYQLGAPAYMVITGSQWPQPMASIEWAYLLIGAMIGAGPLVFKK